MPAGRPKKLTLKRLREGVEAYFDSISYERPVMERVKTDRKDADGHWIYEEIPVTNRKGQELKITLFTQPPSKGALYTFLGIHKSTWSRWLEDEKLRPVCEDAAQRIENFWAGELNGKNANGAIKMLERAFDWRAEQTIHMTGGIEDYLERLKDAGGGEQEF